MSPPSDLSASRLYDNVGSLDTGEVRPREGVYLSRGLKSWKERHGL